jgi:hypothetical protein
MQEKIAIYRKKIIPLNYGGLHKFGEHMVNKGYIHE